MHKVSRSLLFASIVALGGLAACGDDVTIPPTQVVGTVAVSPNPATVAVNGTLNMVADRGGAAAGQTVAWSSSNPAIASVDAASGVVTGKSNGTVAITATTTGGHTGSATVNVGNGGGTASVTIASVTTGDLMTPVTTDNVFGQIDVTLNIDAAGQTLSKVELVVTDSATGAAKVCATQTISSASLAAKAAGVSASVVGANESVAAASTVTLSCNTAAVAANGAVTFTNGPKAISARVYNAAGTLINSAANSVRVRFNNASGFVLSVANTPTTPAALRNATGTAVSTVDHLAYVQGGLTITLTGANFEPGQAANFAAVSGSFAGSSPATPALDFKRTEGTQNFVATVKVADLAAAGVYTITPSVTSFTEGGSVGPTNMVVTNGNNVIRVDNVVPVTGPVFVATLPDSGFWVNDSFKFASTNDALVTPLPAPADLNVGGVKVKFFTGSKAVLDTITLTKVDFASTALTEISTATALQAGLSSNAYGLLAVAYDALGNYVATRPLIGGNKIGFGVDRVAPTGLKYAASVPATDKSVTVAPVIAFNTDSIFDNASGFAVSPINLGLTYVGSNGQTVCAVGTTKTGVTGCNAPAAVAKTGYSFTPTVEGYYTSSAALLDRAGNAGESLARFFLFDATAPVVSTDNVDMPGTITGGTSVSFSKTMTDNLDLASGSMSLRYPDLPNGITLRAEQKALGSFGLPLEKTATQTFTVAKFISSIQRVNGAGAPVAVTATAVPNKIRFSAVDQAGNLGVYDNALTSTIAGTVKDFTTSGIGSWLFAPSVTAKPVNNDAKATKDMTVDLVAVVQENAALSTSAIFDVVTFYYVEPLTRELIRIGDGTVSVITDNANVRTFTYKLAAWDPPAALGVGTTVDVYAIGFSGNHGLAAQQVSITLQTQPAP